MHTASRKLIVRVYYLQGGWKYFDPTAVDSLYEVDMSDSRCGYLHPVLAFKLRKYVLLKLIVPYRGNYETIST